MVRAKLETWQTESILQSESEEEITRKANKTGVGRYKGMGSADVEMRRGGS